MNLRKSALVIVPAAMAFSLLGVGGASAASDNANCVGQLISTANRAGSEVGLPGLGGRFASQAAQEFGGLGENVRNKCAAGQ